MAAQPPSRALGRLRKAGRIFGYVLGALVGLVVLTVITVFLVGRSDWGRKKILALVIPAVNDVLTGTLKVGALDGDLTHMLVLRDIELDDPEGRPAVRVKIHSGSISTLASVCSRAPPSSMALPG